MNSSHSLNMADIYNVYILKKKIDLEWLPMKLSTGDQRYGC